MKLSSCISYVCPGIKHEYPAAHFHLPPSTHLHCFSTVCFPVCMHAPICKNASAGGSDARHAWDCICRCVLDNISLGLFACLLLHLCM